MHMPVPSRIVHFIAFEKISVSTYIYLDRSLHNIFYANFDSLVRGLRVSCDGVGLDDYK